MKPKPSSDSPVPKQSTLNKYPSQTPERKNLENFLRAFEQGRRDAAEREQEFLSRYPDEPPDREPQ